MSELSEALVYAAEKALEASDRYSAADYAVEARAAVTAVLSVLANEVGGAGWNWPTYRADELEALADEVLDDPTMCWYLSEVPAMIAGEKD